jgi:hypothetical protein
MRPYKRPDAAQRNRSRIAAGRAVLIRTRACDYAVRERNVFNARSSVQFSGRRSLLSLGQRVDCCVEDPRAEDEEVRSRDHCHRG